MKIHVNVFLRIHCDLKLKNFTLNRWLGVHFEVSWGWLTVALGCHYRNNQWIFCSFLYIMCQFSKLVYKIPSGLALGSMRESYI